MFKIGDRVRGKRSGRCGTVVELKVYGVDVDWGGGTPVYEKCANLEFVSPKVKPAHREMRHWDQSYTKSVCEALELHARGRNFGIVPSAVQEALDLLKQYHRDLSIPYNQRDLAWREAHDALIKARQANEAHAHLTQRIIEKDAALVKLRQRMAAAAEALWEKNSLADQPAFYANQAEIS